MLVLVMALAQMGVRTRVRLLGDCLCQWRYQQHKLHRHCQHHRYRQHHQHDLHY